MNTVEKKVILAGMTLPELEEFVTANNEPKFRAKQLHYWIYAKSAPDFDSMTNLSKDFRSRLKDIALISDIVIKQKLVGKDGTIKYLLQYPDGYCVETVLMQFDKRPNLSACVSSQVGCPVGCSFCATGKRGFIRNLTYKEIVDQVLTIQRDSGKAVTNVVYMGQGEPLLNFDEVIKSIYILNNDLEIGSRRITVSTSGIVPVIYRFAEENRQLTLALSLHASTHELREKLIPVEKKYPLPELVKALKYLTDKTGRRFTIEYILIDGINDSEADAKRIIDLFRGLKYNVNLIPYNPVGVADYKAPSPQKIDKFRMVFEKSGKKAIVRLERGADILAACGQLSGQEVN